MNKCITLIVLTFIGIKSSYAYIPTLDSLFTNASNIDVNERTVVASLLITKQEDNTSEEIPTAPMRTAHKFLFGISIPGVPDLLQLDYRDGIFSKVTINEIKTKEKFTSKAFDEELVETKLFYGVLKSLLTNQSDLIINVLKQLDPKITSNLDNIDKEQAYLLRKYKKYLVDKNNEVQGVENPLRPTDPEKRKEVDELLSKNLISESKNVKRVFLNNQFYLIYKSDRLEIKFESESHQLKSIRVIKDESFVEIEFLNYVLFTKGFEFPEVINLKLTNGDTYEVVLKKLLILKDTDSIYRSRLKNYTKQLKDGEDQLTVINKAPFIL